MTLDTAKEFTANSGGQTRNCTFHNAANAVAIAVSLRNSFLHCHCTVFIQNRKKRIEMIQLRGNGIKFIITHSANQRDMRPDTDTPCFQPLLTKSAGDAHGGGHAAGEGAAAGHIEVQPIFHPGREIGVTGPGDIFEVVVIFGADILIVDYGTDGLSCGNAICDAAFKYRYVRFFPLGRPWVLPRCPAV